MSQQSWIHRILVVGTIAAITLPSAVEAQTRVYMGKAAIGESVYYTGAKAQCGDLPKIHSCWQNPLITYIIGRDYVSAIPNCK